MTPTGTSSPSQVTRERLRRSVRAEDARRCRTRLADYIRLSWHVTNPGVRYEHALHIEAIADHVQRQLEEWAQARIDPTFVQAAQDLGIEIPPRTGKSTIVSVAGTSWAWLRWPEMRIGCLSSNPRIAARDARATRALITSDWYQELFEPDWEIKDDQDAIGNFANTAGGWRVARGYDSRVVGEGFDWLLIDDPHDPRDAFGSAAMHRVIDGWDTAVSSRQNDARISIRGYIMQRIGEGDLADHLRKQGWGRLVLPMEAEPYEMRDYDPSPYGWRDPRPPGEVLDPVRFTPHVLAKRRLEAGPYGYAAQYQQRPAPLAGGMIKREWFKRFTMGELVVNGKLDLDCITITVDPTGDATEGEGDNVGLLVVGNKGPRRYVLEDATRKMSYLETCAAIRALLATYPACRKVLVEKSALGPAVVAQLTREVNEGALRTVVLEALTTHMQGSKGQRAMAMVPTLAAGLVYLLDGAAWVEAFIGEHGLFPNGLRDDRVDALSQLIAYYGEESGADKLRKRLGRPKAS